MSTDTTSENESTAEESPDRTTLSRVSVLLRDASRIVLDVAVVGLWVLLVTLLALGEGWSRLQFYSALVLGVVCYVLITTEYEIGS